MNKHIRQHKLQHDLLSVTTTDAEWQLPKLPSPGITFQSMWLYACSCCFICKRKKVSVNMNGIRTEKQQGIIFILSWTTFTKLPKEIKVMTHEHIHNGCAKVFCLACLSHKLEHWYQSETKIVYWQPIFFYFWPHIDNTSCKCWKPAIGHLAPGA